MGGYGSTRWDWHSLPYHREKMRCSRILSVESIRFTNRLPDVRLKTMSECLLRLIIPHELRQHRQLKVLCRSPTGKDMPS